jgi:hypothetical protein
MKYVLLLSLFYKHYKKSSTLKLFLDDQLIDEIVLDKNIDPIPNFQEKHSQTIDKVAIDSHKDSTWVIKRLKGWKRGVLGGSKYIDIPSKLWLYSLELNNTNKHISLNFEIHDNNHTNSFMTNTANACIHRVGLIPENLFYDKQKILSRLCKTTRMAGRTGKKSLIAFEKNYRNDYPFISQYSSTLIGGSKKYTIPIIKKHNIFMLWFGLKESVELDVIVQPKDKVLYPETLKKLGFITTDPYWFWLKRQQSIININY